MPDDLILFQAKYDPILSGTKSDELLTGIMQSFDHGLVKQFADLQMAVDLQTDHIYETMQSIINDVSTAIGTNMQAFYETLATIDIVGKWLESIPVYVEFTGHEPDEHLVLTQPAKELTIPETRTAILPYSPVLAWLEKLLHNKVQYNAKDWRQFEEAIAELLQKDGYDVILGPGRQDGGQDLVAMKEDPVLGFIASIWQAKMLAPGNKVEVGIIRDLAGACILNGTKVTKGIIVTTTYLTKHALIQVERDRHFLGKRDRDDLLRWIEQIKKRW